MGVVSRRVILRPGFVALLSASAYFGSVKLLAVFLFSAAVHELGHIAAAKLMGLKIDRLILSALGAELRLPEGTATSFFQDAALSLSGPLVNLLLAALCAVSGRFPLFLGANLLLGCFNLLPLLPLDGGCALFALMSQLTGLARPEAVTLLLSRMFSVSVVLCGGFFLALDGGKPWLLLIGIWLLWASFFGRGN